MQFTLPTRPPFNFRSVVGSHGWSQLLPFKWDETTGTLSYVLRLSSGQVLEASSGSNRKIYGANIQAELQLAYQRPSF